MAESSKNTTLEPNHFMMLRFVRRATGSIKQIIAGNRHFIHSLGRVPAITLAVLLILQTIFYFSFLIIVPLHYDEWSSYCTFSANSFWFTMWYYPAPNNHIFYNLAARVFILLRIGDEIAVRMPSLIASLITAYYFFKLCKLSFNTFLSLGLLVLIISLHPFIYYSIVSRGYSFVSLFCVLLMYASVKLSENYSQKKYRLLLILSMFLGLYSVPSFLYVLFPLVLILAVYALRQKSKKLFLLFLMDGIIALTLVASVYAIVLFNNDPNNLLKPNSDTSFTLDEEGLDKVFYNLNLVFFQLFHSYKLLLVSVLIFVSLIYSIIYRSGRELYLSMLAGLMFFSPFFIIMIHKVLAFDRTWLYIAFPLLISIGFILKAVGDGLQNAIPARSVFKNGYFFCLTLVGLFIYVMIAFPARHRGEADWEYQLSAFRKNELNPVIHSVHEIGRTSGGAEFYPSEMTWFFCWQANPANAARLVALDTLRDQDLLIVDQSQIPVYKRKLAGYKCVFAHNGVLMFLKR